MSFCLDIGHALRYGEDVESLLEDIPLAGHIHLHGVEEGRDHQQIMMSQHVLYQNIGKRMATAGYQGVVTIEVYSWETLENSLRTLGSAWKEFEIHA